MKKKIKETIANILELDIDRLNDESSPETIEKWDSLKHMNIIIALEEEFNIEFLDEEIVATQILLHESRHYPHRA